MSDNLFSGGRRGFFCCSFLSVKWAFLFEDRGADAAVGGLDVKHGANGGSDVGHVGQATGFARGDVPSHEDEGDVGVALAPRAVVGSSPLGFTGINARAGHNVDLAATSGEIAQLDALLENCGNRVGVDMGHIDRPLDLLGSLERQAGSAHDYIIVEVPTVDGLMVEVECKSHLFLDQFGYAELPLELGIGGSEDVRTAHAAAGQSVTRHAGIAVGAAMVGGEKQQVVVSTDALV